MLKIFRRTEDTSLVDAQIEIVLGKMKSVGVDSEEYPKLMTSLERLYELREKDHPKRVSRDTLVVTGGNLLGILIIVIYERNHVMMSKALSQLRTPRL